jgi:S1-C subfamily serine protease
MFLDITPTGKETKRKSLLDRSSMVRNLFWGSLLLFIASVYLGYIYSPPRDATTELRNIAMIISNGGTTASQGTAFLLSKHDGTSSGYLLTARHVIDNNRMNGTVTLLFPNIKNAKDEPVITTASIKWTTDIPFDKNSSGSLTFDVALLNLDNPDDLPDDVTGFTVTNELEVKQAIAIYGFPESEPFYTNGVVSNTEYDGNPNLMVMSFQLDHGISGAPVYSEETGDVLGIAIAGNGRLANIALKITRVIDLMERDNLKILE